jgi:hypothetical protein
MKTGMFQKLEAAAAFSSRKLCQEPFTVDAGSG